jgi:serine/threonine-protein kinase
MIKRFEREARATCRIGHENIVGITDFARDSRVGYYFVMEHLVGETLGSRLQKLGPMPSPQIIHVACQIADALAATHAKGIVHRDLKPDNVFLVRKRDENSFVKILDFGIVGMADMDDAQPRLARHEAMRGTPAYMSPEQAEGQNPDHRSDIYSLGIMLYELATGQVPYRNAAALAVLEMHRSSEPTPPREARPDLEILPALERIILRALRKSPAQRYQSMREVYNDMVNLSQQIDMRGVMGRLPEHRVDGPPTPAPEDIETEEPEWLDEDLVLLDDGADTNDDLAPIGPTQPMASALDNAPTLMDQPRVPTQDQLEPAAGHSLTAEASVQPSETSAARPSPAVAASEARKNDRCGTGRRSSLLAASSPRLF